MPGRKKSFYGRKVRRPSKRRFANSKIAKSVPGNYKFRRMGYKASITGPTVPVTQFGAYDFFLAELIAVNEFTSLFDQYKLGMVELQYKLSYDPSAQPSLSAIYPLLYYRYDYDDDNTPLNIDEFRQCQTTRMVVLQPNRITKIKVYPKMLMQAYNPTISATVPVKPGWIDCSYPNARHFGLKFAIERLPTGMVITVDTVYHIQCKDPR